MSYQGLQYFTYCIARWNKYNVIFRTSGKWLQNSSVDSPPSPTPRNRLRLIYREAKALD